MRMNRQKTGGVALLTALTLFACEVESNFDGNDAEVGGNDIAQNVAEDTAPVDVQELDTSVPPCGGTCGEFENCVNDACMPSYCPPEGPYGTHPGDTFTDVVVKDCDGNDVHIHELCGANAGYFNLLAGW
jgi:hypothetical protein